MGADWTQLALALPPGWLILGAALLLPILPARARAPFSVAAALLALAQMLLLRGAVPLEGGLLSIVGEPLTLLQLDHLSFAFGLIFHIALVINAIYAWHVRDPVQQAAGMLYAGSAIGAVFAGDWVTLFVYWELTAVTSVFLVWARGTRQSYRSGMRYLIVQIGSGVILLAGIMMLFHTTGSTRIAPLQLGSPASWLILIAFGIKCAFPLLHNWLQDSYPQATITGTVFLSAFTTKLAVYALARTFAGTEILIPIGVTMTLFPVIFAVIENDLRKVLAYSLNNQLGFMVVGIGIGSELALNGTVAHAFCHILYKALLFMSIGAVMFRTGTAKATELGGLHKSMPWTTGFCLVGAASISAFPLFSGFVSKSLILSAVGEQHHVWVMLGLLAASAGVMEHSGIKIPFFAFFAHDPGHRVKEAPFSMLLAMGIAAAMCIGIGVYPHALYSILPYPLDYEPYTFSHVLTQLQLLMFAALAFGVLWRWKLYPAEVRALNLDTDWIYRRLFPDAILTSGTVVLAVFDSGRRASWSRLVAAHEWATRWLGPGGAFPQVWPSGMTALWVAFALVATLLLYFLNEVKV